MSNTSQECYLVGLMGRDDTCYGPYYAIARGFVWSKKCVLMDMLSHHTNCIDGLQSEEVVVKPKD